MPMAHAVVASSIVTQLQIAHKLLNGHRVSTHNQYKLHKWLSSLVATVVHLHAWKEEQGRSKYFAVVLVVPGEHILCL